jgi:hypothetical protein
LRTGPLNYVPEQVCADGLGCIAGDDCAGGKCHNGTCFSCTNGVIDGCEIDVDCGCQCGACADGSACVLDTHCNSNSFCHGGVCVSYHNNVTDGDETCIDGGGSASMVLGYRCGVGEGCNVDMDCLSGNCNSSAASIAARSSLCMQDNIGTSCTSTDP